MKILINAGELKSAFAKIYPFKSKTTTYISNFVLVKKYKFVDKISICTNTLQSYIEISIKYSQVEGEFVSFLLPCYKVKKCLSMVTNDDTIAITVIDNNAIELLESKNICHKIMLQSDKGDVTFTQHAAVSDFPRWSHDTKALLEYSIDKDKFCNIIKWVAPFAAVSNDRPILCNINFSREELATADGFRMGIYKDKDGFYPADKDEVSFNLDVGQMLILAKVLKVSSVDSVVVKVGNTEVLFCVDEEEYSFSRVQGGYPNYNQLVPVGHTKCCSVSVPVFLQRMDMIDGNDLNVRMYLDVEQGVILLRTLDDTGKSFYNLPVYATIHDTQDDSKKHVAVSYKYLYSCIKAFSACDITFTGTSSPVIFNGDIEGLTIICMPVFVTWEDGLNYIPEDYKMIEVPDVPDKVKSFAEEITDGEDCILTYG